MCVMVPTDREARRVTRRANRLARLGAAWASLSLAFGILHFVRLRSPAGSRFLFLRVIAGALSPVWAVLGLLAAVIGVRTRRPGQMLKGVAGFIASAQYIRRIAAVTPPPLDSPPASSRSMPQVQRDLVFHTAELPPFAGRGDRPLYCDLWQPAPGAPRSGLGVVYLHGSAWYLGDKAQMTDPLLAGWAGQGHVVMDVAYRMCPETDLRGMVADARAAVAWLKQHAAEYGLDPRRIVLSGTSAGGHVALIAAYTAAPDAAVAGVFTLSAPIDMAAMVQHHPDMLATAHPAPGMGFDPLLDLDPVVPPGPNGSRRARMRWQRAQVRRLSGLLADLIGGGPEDAVEMFTFASAGTHVRPGLPPTLLIQGDQDVLVPVEPARELYRRLLAAGVKAAYLELPQTDHAFEIAVPQVSPPAHAAQRAITRFLAEL
jgi:acetyl esterase/lipase